MRLEEQTLVLACQSNGVAVCRFIRNRVYGAFDCPLLRSTLVEFDNENILSQRGSTRLQCLSAGCVDNEISAGIR